MQKSVYSLVLPDELVAAVDALAVQHGLSRSAMVSYILAEHTRFQTPETAARRWLATLQKTAQNGGMRVYEQSPSTLMLRTALCCKYNPALTYTVNTKSPDGYFARVQVSLRSQNPAVLAHFSTFIDVWTALERRYFHTPPPQEAHLKEEKRYQRALRILPQRGHESGDALAGYVSMMDACMKTFFSHMGNPALALQQTEHCFVRFLEDDIRLL